ncbi:uncharacterized protein V1513DRAFT_446463 [Lipomyces chichibuensis]|uniref:uncharacterized protein n=1 Tax=Lipomyces chichibuensis TaxID=1546026 RepID=UPI003343C781
MTSTNSQSVTGFWSTIKKYGQQAVPVFGDTDGDTEEETQVHKVLVKYYQQTYGYVPTFLGGTGEVPPTKARNTSRRQAPLEFHHPTTVKTSPVVGHPSQGGYEVRDNARLRNPPPRSASRPSLQDIYQRSHQQHQQLYPQSARSTPDYTMPGAYTPSVHSLTPSSSLPSGYNGSNPGLRSSFDTIDSGRSSGESRVREKLRRRPASPTSSVSVQSSISSTSRISGGGISASMSTITSSDGAMRDQHMQQQQHFERQQKHRDY